MADIWQIRIYNEQVLELFQECSGPIVLGRHDDRVREELFQVSPLPEGGCRVAIAPRDEVQMSRRLACVERISGDRVLVRNESAKNTFGLEGAPPLQPGLQAEAELPIVLKFGKKEVRIQRRGAGGIEATVDLHGLEQLSDLPIPKADEDSVIGTLALNSGSVPDAASVINWLRAMIRVLQSAACDADFFEQAAKAVVDVVQLDLGRVLVREGDRWTTVSFFPERMEEYEQNNPPSRMVLDRVCTEKRTFWLAPREMEDHMRSLAGLSSVVAAPVLTQSGDVIAILYGERWVDSAHSAATGCVISRLDAMLVEVLAVGVAGGLARLEQQRAAFALRTQFEQFFTPELARHLAARPELLTGRDMEISVLFCDIRGFSRISRKHGTAFTLDWINDVLSTLSDCVLKRRGVLVDYIGDELMAIWGAPEEQPDHADRACQAALDMLGTVEGLNLRWQNELGEPMALGIGINSGLARVGNTGSRYKFKYGALGDTVNVGSRVQGVTKYFKSSLLITRATRDLLGTGFRLRRVGAARVVNISEPVDLFELFGPHQAATGELVSAYETALSAFESRDFRKATGILGRLIYSYRDDGPSFALLARAMACMVEEPEVFDPAFHFKDK